jgi:hypothetical protein
MNKKELRKELELTLVKTIEEVLSKKNAESAKKIRKTTHESSKAIAKKFYKAIKEKSPVKPANKAKTKTPVKAKAKSIAPVKKAKSKK